MSRPWTAIASSKQTGKRKAIIFEASFDGSAAVEDFETKYGYDMNLEVLIPGEHKYAIVQNAVSPRKKIPNGQLLSGF
tara:strand:+ start:344 stop:577 length:234 start_codon:yes stop_codon:yes gene_type:complete